MDVRLTLRNVRMAGNRAVVGGALSYESGGQARLLIQDSVIEANLAQRADGGASGGGMALQLRGQACGQILNSTIFFNRVESTFAGAAVSGGGLSVGVDDQASFELRRTTIGYNQADAGDGANPSAAGLILGASGESRVRVEDVRLEGNDCRGPSWPAARTCPAR